MGRYPRNGKLNGCAALLAVACSALALTWVHVAEAKPPRWLIQAFQCIHRYEGAWNANTGNGYYGGLQMDWSFMTAYGREYLRRYGPAHNWTPAMQIEVAARAWRTRGFGPWPNTRRFCGL